MKERRDTAQKEFGSLRSYLPKSTPFLKWAGGKGQLLQQYDSFIPRHFATYLEPFLGGGAVFFHLRPDRAILSDSNPELVNAFRVVRDFPERLMEALDVHHPHRLSKDYYYKLRAQIPTSLNEVERAARTIFLNKTCFNGLYRVNSRGDFNVPFGKYRNPVLYDSDTIRAASGSLRGKIVEVGDYRDTCRYARRDDFVYLDPPYQPLSATASFTGYTKDAFNENDQLQLRNTFEELDRRGCKVMLSNSAAPSVKELYHEYRIAVLRATRAINSKPSGRGAINEFLITNYSR
jgi:DNA adenine methylase